MMARSGPFCHKAAAPLVLFILVLGAALGSSAGCSKETDPSEPDPLDTINELLRLHDLQGAQPEHRSREARERAVDPKALAPLFTDYGDRDRFLDDLYVGFVAGALARFQGDLVVTTGGSRAEVVAGKARIVLELRQGRYRIVLEESIPKEIKRRAKEQQARLKKK